MSVGHLLLVVAVVVAALGFDFINGFHDAANSIATIVSTRVLTPFRAVLWAAFFNFIAFALFKLSPIPAACAGAWPAAFSGPGSSQFPHPR
jgi:PiT family inorganic phosphate transporter